MKQANPCGIVDAFQFKAKVKGILQHMWAMVKLFTFEDQIVFKALPFVVIVIFQYVENKFLVLLEGVDCVGQWSSLPINFVILHL